MLAIESCQDWQAELVCSHISGADDEDAHHHGVDVVMPTRDVMQNMNGLRMRKNRWPQTTDRGGGLVA